MYLKQLLLVYFCVFFTTEYNFSNESTGNYKGSSPISSVFQVRKTKTLERLNNINSTLLLKKIGNNPGVNSPFKQIELKKPNDLLTTENNAGISFSDIILTELYKSKYDALKSIQFSFKIHSHSKNQLQDISIQLLKEDSTEYNTSNEETIKSIPPGTTKQYSVEIPSRDLDPGLNPILIQISFSDGVQKSIVYIDIVKYNYLTSPFNDLALYRLEYPDVLELTNNGIIDGANDKEFKPDSPLTYGEFCKMIVKGKQLPINNDITNGTFADVSSENSYYDYVMTLLNMGIIKLSSNLPVNQSVTNAEMAKMLMWVFGRPAYFDNLETNPFNDVTYNGEPETSGFYISAIKKAGIIGGNCDGNFYPEAACTRAEACMIINKTIKGFSSGLNDYSGYKNSCTLGGQPTKCSMDSESDKYHVKSGDVIKITIQSNDISNNCFIKGKGTFTKIDNNQFEWIVPETYASQIVEIFGGATNGEYTQSTRMYFKVEPSESIIIRMNNEKLDISHVVDVSGSMYSAMAIERASVRAQISLQEEGDNVTVIAFDHKAKLISPRLVIQEQITKPSIISALDKLVPSGMTSIGAGLEMAIQEFQSSTYKNKYIILFSDGQENTSPMVSQVLEQISQDITVFCLGYSQGADQALLSAIARARNGKFLFIQNVRDINEAYLRILSLIKKLDIIVSKNQSISNKVAPNLYIDSVFLNGSVYQFSTYFTRTNPSTTHRLISPSGKEISMVDASLNHDITFKFDSIAESFTIKNPEEGLWKIKITGNDYFSYILSAKTGINFMASLNKNTNYQTNEPIIVNAEVKYKNKPQNGENLSMKAVISIADQNEDQLKSFHFIYDESLAPPNYYKNKSPNATTKIGTQEYDLFDNGDMNNGDSIAGDGIYSMKYANQKRCSIVNFDLTATGKIADSSFVRKEFLSAPIYDEAPLAMISEHVIYFHEKTVSDTTLTFGFTDPDDPDSTIFVDFYPSVAVHSENIYEFNSLIVEKTDSQLHITNKTGGCCDTILRLRGYSLGKYAETTIYVIYELENDPPFSMVDEFHKKLNISTITDTLKIEVSPGECDPPNDRVHYKIIEHNDKNIFEIDEQGNLTVHDKYTLKKTNSNIYHFTIEFEDSGEPSFKDQVNATIEWENDFHFKIPNVITPENQDGYNDFWIIDGMKYFSNISFKLCNIQGKLIYQKDNITETDIIWDGKDSNNEFVIPGIYYYILSVNGTRFKGELMIKK